MPLRYSLASLILLKIGPIPPLPSYYYMPSPSPFGCSPYPCLSPTCRWSIRGCTLHFQHQVHHPLLRNGSGFVYSIERNPSKSQEDISHWDRPLKRPRPVRRISVDLSENVTSKVQVNIRQLYADCLLGVSILVPHREENSWQSHNIEEEYMTWKTWQQWWWFWTVVLRFGPTWFGEVLLRSVVWGKYSDNVHLWRAATDYTQPHFWLYSKKNHHIQQIAWVCWLQRSL